MSITHPSHAVLASITILSALWISNTQGGTPARSSSPTLSPGAAGLTGLQDDDRSEKKPESKAFRPVVRVSSLMAGHGMAFGNVHEALFKKEKENRLDSIGKWSDVVAELSNVHTRYRRKPAYIEMATETRLIALELAGAARADAPDETVLEALFEKLNNSCAACHESDH